MQYAAAAYPGRKQLLSYETPLYPQMEVDQKDERYEHQGQEVCHNGVRPTAVSTSLVVVMLARPIAASTAAATVLSAQPTVAPVQPLGSMVSAVKELKAPEAPMLELSLEQRNEEMEDVLWFQDDLELMNHFNSIIPSSAKKVGPASKGLAGSSHAPGGLGPSKSHRGCKLPDIEA
ncbi:hypothetical protein C0992_005572 [Termitomyces sp. T32_za158]|nr:hypothetical protein C0992_005572 [Termitomyces sp. T32_za158]